MAGYSPTYFQKLFRQHVGLSPKRYQQLQWVEAGKNELKTSQLSTLAISESMGLSSASRLHEPLVQLEAVSPAECREWGNALTITYGVHQQTPLGPLLLAQTGRGICFLAFLHSLPAGQAMAQLKADWPNATYLENPAATGQTLEQLLNPENTAPPQLLVKGSNFQVQVWKALLRVPSGQVTHYEAIARALGKPKASRAVGSAVGKNPITWLIPCHRVIRKDGLLKGYRWGTDTKTRLLASELGFKLTQDAEHFSLS